MVLRRLAPLCLLASLLLSTRAEPQTYQPLDSGLRWVYISPNGVDRDTIISAGPAVFDGVDVVEFRYHGFNEGLSNFWTVAADGAVLLHGFDIPAESFGVHYDPPIRLVQPPVVPGNAWRDTVYDYCVRSPEPCEGDTVGTIWLSTVNAITPLTVPAGTFTAVAVELGLGFATSAVPPSPRYSILGTRVPAENMALATGGQVRWWAEDTGLIQDYDGWSLMSFDQATEVRPVSWGQLKTLYR